MRPRVALVIALLLAACVDPPAGPPVDQPLRVLVFSRTTGFRHASIPAGVAAVHAIGTANGILVDATEIAEAFTPSNLARYRAIVFLNTTGDVLDSAQQAAVEQFVQCGGGFVGVHSAADTEYDWPWYGGLVGAYFASHPAIQSATLIVTDPTHPSTVVFPSPISRTDEWYNFQAPPGPAVTVLVRVDETTYSGGTMGATHPISWSQTYDGGRAWYTAMGHTDATYAEPAFIAHLTGGILWAVGVHESLNGLSARVVYQ
jgi:type 1 glutamine amidotransferase